MLEQFNQNINGPKTHIFLIGIGGYPYLKGGTQEKPQTEESAAMLGQLTSPVESIAALYERFTSYHTENAWIKPLGSIELLLTPAPGAAPVLPGKNIENASLDNIRTAWFAWKDRCDTDAGNVAIFYYSGHGAEKIHHFLLADDFGKIPANPWTGAFNFDLSRTSFYTCKAETQLFFADACRQITSDMLEDNLVVSPIDNPSLLTSESRFNLTMKATASGQAAYGKIGEPTYFTQALINGLNGLVARRDSNRWLVETGGICRNIHDLLDLVEPSQSFRQRCQFNSGNSAAILGRDEPPQAWLEVSCDPDLALQAATLSCSDLKKENIQNRTPGAGPWKLNLKAGFYTVAASFAPGTYNNVEITTSAIPPLTREKLRC